MIEMSLYEGLKDVAKVVQQADNVELYKRLLDLSALALDMQDEIARLKEENIQLRKREDVSNRVIRHQLPFITLEGDEQGLHYCSHCWDSEKSMIQLMCWDNGKFECPHCNIKGIYDKEKMSDYSKKQVDNIAKANSQLNRKSYWNGF